VYDLIVVGSGGAGLCASIEARKRGLSVAVICEHKPTDASTCMAQGGLNAVVYDDEDDSPKLHAEDTLKGGFGLANSSMVKRMCYGAKEDALWLDSIGMPFSRENGRIARRQFGAASKKRALYAQDYTGLKLLHTLFDNALKEGVEFLDSSLMLDLVVEDSTCKGVVVLDNRVGKVKAYASKSVVLATGGYAGVYGSFTSSAKNSTGDGVAIAFKNGAMLSDMEFVQFHPTALKSSSILVSEGARGAGGVLVDSSGKRFVDELASRDEVSRAVFKKIKEGKQVYLDIRHLGGEFIDKNLPQEKKLMKIYEDIDPLEDLIPIKPVAHYSIGGVLVDENLQTTITGLFAVGECANTKVHGANRLGGNSLLEIVHFGRAVVSSVSEYVKDVSLDVDLSSFEKKEQCRIDSLLGSSSESFFTLREELSKKLFEEAGIYRNGEALKSLLGEIDEIAQRFEKLKIADKNLVHNTWLTSHLKFSNSLLVAKALALSALKREESRGAHFREDFQKPSSEALHSIVSFKDGEILVGFKR